MNKQNVSYNYRSSFKDRQVDYIASLRDSAIFNLYGIQVTFKIPKVENNVDEYINYKDEDFYLQKAVVVPKFKEYRQVLSQLGVTAEENYPLEIAVPSSLHVPRNSRLILNEWNAQENKVAREWKVLSSQIKQLSDSKNYTNIIQCVPARVNILVTSNVEIGSCIIISGDPETGDITVPAEVIKENFAWVVCNCKVNTPSRSLDPIREDTTAYAQCTLAYRLLLPSIVY